MAKVLDTSFEVALSIPNIDKFFIDQIKQKLKY